MKGSKHLIQCHCMLPQLKNKGILHQFVVFSTEDDQGIVKTKFAQCNNCGVIHKVIDYCKSIVMNGKEELKSILTIDDIKLSIMSKDLCALLERSDCDLATWEQVKFIIENKKWGHTVTLSSSLEEGIRVIKYLQILGEDLFKVETYTKE